jgi:nucleoid-associated protein YgaU
MHYNQEIPVGLFDFVKGAGEKIFHTEEKAAAADAAETLAESQKANQLLRFAVGMQLPVEELKVQFDDGVATVFGKADNTAVKENIIIGIGNIDGVSQVDDRMTVERVTPPAVFYTVKAGDSLSKIAKEHFEDPMRYKEIFEANQPMLKNPDLIYPGQVLRIPQS